VGYSRWPRWTRARGLPAVAFATLDSTSRDENRAEAERFGLACKWSRNRSRECPTELRRQRGLAPSKLDVTAGRCSGDGTVAGGDPSHAGAGMGPWKWAPSVADRWPVSSFRILKQFSKPVQNASIQK
jgi:hypothetical protein